MHFVKQKGSGLEKCKIQQHGNFHFEYFDRNALWQVQIGCISKLLYGDYVGRKYVEPVFQTGSTVLIRERVIMRIKTVTLVYVRTSTDRRVRPI